MIETHFNISGEYSGIIASLLFTRNFHIHFVKSYLPVLIIVLVSWIQFRINGLSEARIAIALSTILLLSWFYLSRTDQLTISYMTYLDMWRAINYLFVFLAAVESFYVINTLKYVNTKVRIEMKRSLFCNINSSSSMIKLMVRFWGKPTFMSPMMSITSIIRIFTEIS